MSSDNFISNVIEILSENISIKQQLLDIKKKIKKQYTLEDIFITYINNENIIFLDNPDHIYKNDNIDSRWYSYISSNEKFIYDDDISLINNYERLLFVSCSIMDNCSVILCYYELYEEDTFEIEILCSIIGYLLKLLIENDGDGGNRNLLLHQLLVKMEESLLKTSDLIINNLHNNNTNTTNNINKIISHITEVIKYINAIKDLQEIYNDQLHINKDPHDFLEIMEEIKELIYIKENIVVKFNVKKTVPKYLVLDKMRLTQVVSNLINEIIHKIDEGIITVMVNYNNLDLSNSSHSDNYLEFLSGNISMMLSIKIYCTITDESNVNDLFLYSRNINDLTDIEHFDYILTKEIISNMKGILEIDTEQDIINGK